jgi:hypothetical protein
MVEKGAFARRQNAGLNPVQRRDFPADSRRPMSSACAGVTERMFDTTRLQPAETARDP